MRQAIDGLLLLDKPSGISSNHLLQKAKRLLNAKKAGHAGTLDPLASGMLVICLGQATKYAQYLLDGDKAYQVTLKLGQTTDTLDSEGQLLSQTPVGDIATDTILEALSEMVGPQMQVPPMYSALKHQGRPLYELARAGKTVERPPRQITLYKNILLSRTEDTITLEVHCSKGTYIRSVAVTLGERLGPGAHVIALRRLSAAPFSCEQMHSWQTFEDSDLTARLSMCLPIDSALQSYPPQKLSPEEGLALQQGRVLEAREAPEGLYRLYQQETFIGLGQIDPQQRLLAQRLLQV